MSGGGLRFNPVTFGPIFGPLLAVDRLPELEPGRPDESQRQALEHAAREGFSHLKIKQPLAAKAVTAGMWLLFDFLDESHEISQSLPDDWGAYWHGIMHRREPDPGNAAYWFRRVGDDSIEQSLKIAALEFGYDYRGPFEFIKDCEQVRGSGSETEQRLRAVQLAEIRFLLQHHFDVAAGSRQQS